MECARRILPSSNGKVNKSVEEKGKSFLENGSMLLEGLIASNNGRYDNYIRNFSAKELIRATNNFDYNHAIVNRGWYAMFWGPFGERRIFIKKFAGYRTSDDPAQPYAVRDTVVTVQMSKHKNVLKLIGCCLEFRAPTLVYEYAGTKQLSNLLFDQEGVNSGRINTFLSWENRLKIANDVANVVVYLHTAFSRPIIHRNLKPSNVILDQSGVAKIIDFAFSITLPPGESEVEDLVTGTRGFVDPTYQLTGMVSEKSDVYSFGMFLLELITGERAIDSERGDDFQHLHDYVKMSVENDKFDDIVDSRIIGEGRVNEQEQQLKSFAELALRCVRDKGEDRPEMIDVAKELRRIKNSIRDN